MTFFASIFFINDLTWLKTRIEGLGEWCGWTRSDKNKHLAIKLSNILSVINKQVPQIIMHDRVEFLSLETGRKAHYILLAIHNFPCIKTHAY